MSDDLAMGALSGEPSARAAAAVAAGCDIALFCSGEPGANASVLAACPELTPTAAAHMRAAADLARARRQPLDEAALAAEREKLLA
jgi:beta-N-acetylhexosaminidase